MIGLRKLVKERFSAFGVNKTRQITRLIYEIAKRDKISCKKALDNIPSENLSYDAVKKFLVGKRFPYSTTLSESIDIYLPKLKINQKNAVIIRDLKIYPKNIYIEESAKNSYLAGHLKGLFPLSGFRRIKSLKDFIKTKRAFTISDYNKRLDNFFVINEKYDFFKKCPCTKSAVSCGYHVFNLGFGCVFECTYCYLQQYTNCPGIILPSNIEDFFDKFRTYQKTGMRIGTGEFTDSLALDHITGYSIPLVEFFNKNPGATFEFKTKSDNIENMLKSRHEGNIVISWSLNPERIIKENEFYAASLRNRLKAALSWIKTGGRVGFHFDPIIYYKRWERDYKEVVNMLFDLIPAKKIAWISLGTLRFNPRLKPIIENRFPDNKILDEELLIGFDNKLRYPDKLRLFIYEKMLHWIKKRDRDAQVYLCMENVTVNKDSRK